MSLRRLVLGLSTGLLGGVPEVQAQRLHPVAVSQYLPVADSGRLTTAGAHGTPRLSPAAAIACDGSAVRAVESKKRQGTLMFAGGIATLVLSNFLPKKQESVALVAGVGVAGAGVAILGYRMRSASIDPEYVSEAFRSFKVGETRAADVVQCLGQPTASTTSGSETVWTYIASRRGMLSGGSVQSTTVTFRNGVLAGFRTASSGTGM